MGRQQAGAGAVGAGIELDAEHAQGIDAKTDHALGVARFQVEHEALGPFVALGLLRTGAIAKVAVEVHVAGFEGGAAVFEKSGLGERRKTGKGGGAGERGGVQADGANGRGGPRLRGQHR
ncbi:hypothetical protein D3C86_1905520 [compost metagenome]